MALNFSCIIFARGHQMSVLDRDLISKISPSDDLHDLQFVSFDVETTGLSPVVARLVELSGVKFNLLGGESTSFSSLINPEMPIPPEVSQIHGITDDMVADAPNCAEVVRSFIEWIGDEDTVLVAHNAPFDVEFLHVAMARLQAVRPSNRVVDTLPLARALLRDAPNHQLKTLVEHLELEAGDYHRALADSYHVKNILHRLVGDNNVTTVSELVELGCVFNFGSDLYTFEPAPELQEAIASINNAIANGSSLSFMYSGYRSFKRTVDPLALIQSRGNYYLTAYCKKVLAERTFRLDRISKLTTIVLERSADRPAEAAS
jgi:DNA polymerase III epsilon subunit family exonuclease